MNWLNSDRALKIAGALTALAAAVVAATPEHTVAHRVALGILGLGAALGVTSTTGRATKTGEKGSARAITALVLGGAALAVAGVAWSGPRTITTTAPSGLAGIDTITLRREPCASSTDAGCVDGIRLSVVACARDAAGAERDCGRAERILPGAHGPANAIYALAAEVWGAARGY